MKHFTIITIGIQVAMSPVSLPLHQPKKTDVLSLPFPHRLVSRGEEERMKRLFSQATSTSIYKKKMYCLSCQGRVDRQQGKCDKER